jgi:hypothetical protein
MGRVRCRVNPGLALPAEYPFDQCWRSAGESRSSTFVVTPMRHLPSRQGLRLAAKADFLALTASEIGLFGWVAITQLMLFP